MTDTTTQPDLDDATREYHTIVVNRQLHAARRSLEALVAAANEAGDSTLEDIATELADQLDHLPARDYTLATKATGGDA